MIAFIIFAVLLVLALEHWMLGTDLKDVDSSHRPDVRVAEPDQVFRVQVTLKNRSRRMIPFLRVTETFEEPVLPAGKEPAGKKDRFESFRHTHDVEFTTWLRRGQTVTRAVPVSIPQRGRYVLREFKLSAGDFLGLKETEKTCGRFCEVVVAPREIRARRLDEMFGGYMGELSVNRFILEDPVLTLGYREYTGREPMKMISWKQSAKGAGLMVKKYDYTVEPTVTVILNVDTPAENREELAETCFSLARSVCAMLEKQGVKYDFVTNSVPAGAAAEITGEGLGRRHFGGVLETLGRATCQNNISLERLLEKECRRSRAAGRILITPGAGEENARALNRLQEFGGTVMVLRGSEVSQWQ